MTQPLSNESLAISKPVAVLERAALAQAVAIATLAVERRPAIPILSNLLLTGAGDSLTVTGTDLDIEVNVRLPGAADSRLAVTVPAHLLKDILAKAKTSDLASIDDAGEGRAGVDMGGVRFNLQALPASDYPDMSKPAATFTNAAGQVTTCDHLSYQVATADFAKALDRTRFAISTEETRYYLNGVYLHFARRGDENLLSFVATDGHRLARFDLPAVAIPADIPGLIVPRKTVDLLLKVISILSKGKAELPPVAIDCTSSKIRFVIGAVEITSKVIDGTFPDYERVVPRNNDKPATMSVKALGEAIAQVALISQDRARKIKFSFADGTCRLTCNDPEAGTAETDVPCSYDSGEFEIGFNSRLVLDALAEISGDAVTFAFGECGGPTVITDPADARFSSVLMPMRV